MGSAVPVTAGYSPADGPRCQPRSVGWSFCRAGWRGPFCATDLRRSGGEGNSEMAALWRGAASLAGLGFCLRFNPADEGRCFMLAASQAVI